MAIEHPSTAGSRSPPPLARVYGLRLLYQPRPRGRLLLGAAALTTAGYAWYSLRQLVGLKTTDLRFDFAQYYLAAADLLRGQDPYASFLASCPHCQAGDLGGYIYSPLLAELMRPLALLPQLLAARVWLVLVQLMLIGSMVVVYRALRGMVSPATWALLLVATLLFRPLHYTLFFLQVGTLLLLLLSLSAAAFVRGGSSPQRNSGAWLGAAAVMRVTPVLMAPVYLVFRRGRGRWWVPSGIVGGLAAGLSLVAGLWLLTPATQEYYSQVLPRLAGSAPSLDNQSLPGVVARAFVLAAGVSPPAILVGLAAAVIVIGSTWWLASRLRVGAPHARAAVFAAFLAAVPIASNLTWQHHLVSELLVLALLAPSLETAAGAGPDRRRRLRRAGFLALVAYPFLWADRHVTDAIIGGLGLAQPSGWRVVPFLLVTGANLLGMVCLWLACLQAIRALSVDEAVDGDSVPLVHAVQAAV